MENAVVTAVFAVFTAILNWFGEAIATVSTIFYVAGTGLTFIGVISVTGLGIGVVLLIIGLMKGWIRLR